MVRRSSSTYNGEVSASSGVRGSKSKRDEGAVSLPAQDEAMNSSETE